MPSKNMYSITKNLQPITQTVKSNLSFHDIFSLNPRPLQQLTDGICANGIPDFTLIEDNMGGGKTNTALNIAYHGLEQGKQGILFLMPTNATVRSMESVFDKFISVIAPNYRVKMLGSKNGLIYLAEGNNAYAESDFSQFYSGNAKLLYPFSIMTVDQAMRAVASSKNVTQLLVEMSNKVVIFDEVHNYDPYMAEYIKDLLKWLKFYHAPVIMLSATVSTQQRQEILSIYSNDLLENHRYPCITTCNDKQKIIQWFPKIQNQISKQYRISCAEVSDLQNTNLIAKNILNAANQYNVIFVIRNTVKNAIHLYDTLVKYTENDGIKLILFHSLMPDEFKIHRTNYLLNAFGKNGFYGPLQNFPQKTIVIATEVIEQSMDISCDMLFTDLAPIKELLQRLGREIRFGNRSEADVCIWIPEIDNLGNYQARSLIYHRALLDATKKYLENHREITVPGDNVEAIERVDELVKESEYYADYLEAETDRAQKAKSRIIPSPDQSLSNFFTPGAMMRENEKTRDNDYTSVIVIVLQNDLWAKYNEKKLQALTEKQKADLIYHYGVTIPSYRMKKIENNVSEQHIKEVGFAAGLRCYFVKSSEQVYIDQDKGLICE